MVMLLDGGLGNAFIDWEVTGRCISLVHLRSVASDITRVLYI
jgi:hypothetical protein